MHTYTMTFVTGDIMGLPSDTESNEMIIRAIVTEKLIKQEFELADFNWSGSYTFDNSLSYLNEPYQLNAVVEVCVKLDIVTMRSREAIYARCLHALKLHEVLLKRIKCLTNLPFGPKCILCFDMNAIA
ncbi:hypothetical protein [Flavobacterium cerinum]|uniref:Uncharacterized protein n=1 Tax=Flavobacterium cerinum TaxID=2502784 RepID=A0A3S3RD06_9FLAO|nr:hypothetical protein [Flavobacterium cerinum]RWW91762.1 hypothetical protein EPI11_17925 [Flavobacterium cerinum]